MIWMKDAETLKRRSFKGMEGGLDLSAAVELFRETVSKKCEHKKITQQSQYKKEAGEKDGHTSGRPRRPKLAEEDRAILNGADRSHQNRNDAQE